LEYIVIDGGSTDSSVEILRKNESRLALWLSERDGGQSDAFNKGLVHSTGEIIGWLNSDDLYLNSCIHRAAEFFREHPDVDIVFSDYCFIDEQDRVLRRRREIPFSYSTYLWTRDCYHANCAGFFRRKVFDKTGPLRQDLQYGMDYEFYMRAAKAGFKFGHQREYWGAYRLHKASKSISASSLLRKEAGEIARQFTSPGTGHWKTRLFYRFWSGQRILRKAVSGSYLPWVARAGETRHV
jgi:glycosyltransferase involved in cell wall biosynthesis